MLQLLQNRSRNNFARELSFIKPRRRRVQTNIIKHNLRHKQTTYAAVTRSKTFRGAEVISSRAIISRKFEAPETSTTPNVRARTCNDFSLFTCRRGFFPSTKNIVSQLDYIYRKKTTILFAGTEKTATERETERKQIKLKISKLIWSV